MTLSVCFLTCMCLVRLVFYPENYKESDLFHFLRVTRLENLKNSVELISCKDWHLYTVPMSVDVVHDTVVSLLSFPTCFLHHILWFPSPISGNLYSKCTSLSWEDPNMLSKFGQDDLKIYCLSVDIDLATHTHTHKGTWVDLLLVLQCAHGLPHDMTAETRG
jgi:hypothetical protein